MAELDGTEIAIVGMAGRFPGARTLDDFCRAAELHNLGAMIKVDQEPRGFITQRAIGSGFQSVLFADIRTVQDLLGHEDVATTMIYTHVMQKPGIGVKSPLDSL